MSRKTCVSVTEPFHVGISLRLSELLSFWQLCQTPPAKQERIRKDLSVSAMTLHCVAFQCAGQVRPFGETEESVSDAPLLLKFQEFCEESCER